MAKLNVVIPEADVEVIGKDGARTKYRKVERAAEKGDVIKITDNDVTSYVIDGAFYEVTRLDFFGDPRIIGEDGYEFDAAGVDYEVYEKVAESAQIKYREVKRQAKVGERIKIVDAWFDGDKYKNGDILIVDSVVDGATYVSGVSTPGNLNGYVSNGEYVVLEPVDGAARGAESFEVGEYVKVVDASGDMGAKVGDIAVVVASESGLIEVKTVDGREVTMYAKRFVHATEAEVEVAKQALKYGDFADGDYAQIVNAMDDNANSLAIENAGKFVTVTREIGPSKVRGLRLQLPNGELAGFANADALRKVTREEYEAAVDPRNQFAKGDKVRIVSGAGERFLLGYKNGDIVEIRSGADEDGDYSLSSPRDGVTPGSAKADQLEKVSAEELAEIERWAAIGRKVGEFKPGDLIKVKRNSVAAGVISGEFGEVREVDAGAFRDGVRLTKLNPQGIHAWVGYDDIELIVPVEQRFDREEAA